MTPSIFGFVIFDLGALIFFCNIAMKSLQCTHAEGVEAPKPGGYRHRKSGDVLDLFFTFLGQCYDIAISEA